MKNTQKIIAEKLINLIRTSEIKYKQGQYKEALEDKRQISLILNSESSDFEIKKIFKEEISRLYNSKFDLIFDHKEKINEFKRKEIINLLEKKSKEKYLKGDFKGAIKALRRSEKYL